MAESRVEKICLNGDVPFPTGYRFLPHCPKLIAHCREFYPSVSVFIDTHACPYHLYALDDQSAPEFSESALGAASTLKAESWLFRNTNAGR